MKNPLSNAILLFLAILLSTPLYALTWDDSDNGFLDTKAIQQLAGQATREKYPDADTVILESDIRIAYQTDGSFVQVADCATKIMTLAGLDEKRVLQSYYNASYSRAKISLVQILRPSGEIVDLDLAQCTQEMIDDSQMGSNIYNPNDRIVKVSVANLQPGDVLRAVYVDENAKPRVPNSFSDLELFEGTAPILHASVLIDAPQELPLRSIAVKDIQNGGPTYRETEKDGRHIHVWEVKDVSQVFPEPASPSLTTYLQRLLVSTFTSWEEVSRWYSVLCEPRLQVDDAIRDGVAKLTEGCSTDEEKILALYNFVSQKVRYMGLTLEDTAPGYEPHDVTRTFQQRAGVCRDMAALLVAMLRTAGYEAHPTLIHVGSIKDAEVPQPYFNHAITAVKFPGADEWTLMDPTNTNTVDPFPSYLSDKSYLVATPDGDPLRTSPVRPYQENQLEISTGGKLTPEGELLLSTSILFRGITDDAYRDFFLSATPEQRRLFFEHQLASAVPGARLTRLQILPEDLQDLTHPLQALIAFRTADALVTAQNPDGSMDQTPGAAAMLRFPRLSGAFGLNLMVFGRATLAKRRFPLEARTTCAVSELIQLDLPENLQLVSAPQYNSIDNEQFALTRSLETRPGSIRLESLYATKAMRFSPQEYLELKKALAVKETDDRKMAILRFNEALPLADQETDLKTDKPDLEILEERTAITVHSATSWTVDKTLKFQVMTYAGIQSADISFAYNPAWEEIEIMTARVTNGNVTQETPPENINLMDAPWAASAPRYPAGKILVVNLPGVEVGSQVELQFQRTLRGRPFIHFAEILRGDDPVHFWSLDILAPKEVGLEPKFYPNGWMDLASDLPQKLEVKTHREETPGEQIHFHYECKDIPALHKETAKPPAYAYLPMVVGTTGHWSEYANTLKCYVESLGDGGSTIQKLVKPLLGLPEEERAVKIREWIEKNIRTTNPPFTELPLACLSAPETTANDGYGNSADTAILYHAMLEAAGLHTALFLAGKNPQLPELKFFHRQNPTDGAFQKWLARIIVDGKEIWLNDQTQYGQFGTCVFDHGMLLSLQTGNIRDLELDEEYSADPFSEWELELQEDGSALLKVRETIRGDSFGKLKRFYDRLTPEERRRHYQKIISGIAQDAVPVSEDIETDFMHYPGTLSYTIKLNNCATLEGDFCYFRLPVTLSSPLADAGPDRKYHPLFRQEYQKSKTILTVTLPALYPKIVLMPPDFKWNAPDNTNAGTISWTHRPLATPIGTQRKYQFEFMVDLPPIVTSIRHFPEYQDAYRKLKHPGATTILLSK